MSKTIIWLLNKNNWFKFGKLLKAPDCESFIWLLFKYKYCNLGKLLKILGCNSCIWLLCKYIFLNAGKLLKVPKSISVYPLLLKLISATCMRDHVYSASPLTETEANTYIFTNPGKFAI